MSSTTPFEGHDCIKNRYTSSHFLSLHYFKLSEKRTENEGKKVMKKRPKIRLISKYNKINQDHGGQVRPRKSSANQSDCSIRWGYFSFYMKMSLKRTSKCRGLILWCCDLEYPWIFQYSQDSLYCA